MLKTKVKVGRVTNLSEARYCAGMGVDFLSFPVSSVDPKTYQEITGWVAGPSFGIEIDSNHYDEYKADFFEVTIESINKIPEGKKAFVHLSVNEWFEKKQELIRFKENIYAIELKAHSIDDAKSIVEEIAKEFEVFLRLPTTSSIETILELPIAGISLEGNSETRPGLKEYPLSQILERLEVD